MSSGLLFYRAIATLTGWQDSRRVYACEKFHKLAPKTHLFLYKHGVGVHFVAAILG